MWKKDIVCSRICIIMGGTCGEAGGRSGDDWAKK